MKEGTKIVLAAGGTFIAAGLLRALFSANQTAQALQVKVLSVNIKSVTQVTLKMQFFNPTKNSLNIDSISGEFYFNGKQLGVLQYINSAPIAPLGYTTIDNVLVELSPGGAITLVTEIITRAAKSGTVAVNGKVYVKGVGIPFNQTVKVW